MKVIRKLSWQHALLLIMVLIIGLPSLWMEWMIIDDGVSLLMSEKISEYLRTLNFSDLSNLLLEREAGRFRPAYWLFQWVTFLISGKSALIQHILHLLICVATVYLIFAIIDQLTKSKSSALIGSLLFLVFAPNIENWYRLGPVEPSYTLYLALFVFLLVKTARKLEVSKKINNKLLFLTLLPLALAYFTKETSFVLLPVVVFFTTGIYLIYRNKKNYRVNLRTLVNYMLVNILLVLVTFVFVSLVRNSGTYSSNYSPTLKDIFMNGGRYLKLLTDEYGLLTWIFGFSFLFFTIESIKNKKFSLNQFWQLTFIIGFFGYLVIQFPWPFVLGRYLEPAILFLSLVVGLESHRLIGETLKLNGKLILSFPLFKKKLRKIAFPVIAIRNFAIVITFVLVLASGLPRMLSYGYDNIVASRNIAFILKYLAEKAGQNGGVYFNFQRGDATIELVFESDLHLKHIYGRPDLTIDYLSEENGQMRKLNRGDLIVNAFVSENYIAFPKVEISKNATTRSLKIYKHETASFLTNSNYPKEFIKSVRYRSPKPKIYYYSPNQKLWTIDLVI